jgi:multiple sugar transport system substrate-binding protein
MQVRKLSNRRAFLKITALGTVGALLAACAPASTPAATTAPAPTTAPAAAANPTETPKPTVAAQPAAAGGQPVSLTIVWRTSVGEQKAMERVWGDFQKQNPNIKIEPQYATGCEVDKKIELLVAAGDPPALWSSIACQGLRYYASRDKVVVLDDYIARDKYDLSDFYETVMPLCKWKGKQIGFPVLQAPIIMDINLDLFEKAGVPVPPRDWNDPNWNWNKWLEAATKLTVRDSSGKATQYAMASIGDSRYSALRDHGTDWFDLQGILDTGYPTKIFPDKDLAIQALQWDQDLMWKQKVIPLPGEVQAMQAGAPNLFMTGKIAMQEDSSFAFKSLKDVKAFKWTVAPIPAPNNAKRFNFMYPDQYTILKPQKNEEAAWTLLKFMTSADGYKAYPIEGNGGLSPRKSLAGYWGEQMAAGSGKSADEIKVASDGMVVEQTAWGHPSVEYDRFWSEGIKPSLDKLMANQIDAKAAVSEIEAACTKILTEVAPKA